jgi:hypothetical protein
MYRRPLARALLALLVGAVPALAQTAPKGPEDLSPSHRRAILAIKNGDMAGLKAELDAGLSADSKDWEDNPLLLRTIQYNQPAMVGELVRRGADVNWKSSEFQNGYLHACVFRDKPALIDAFLDAGADIDLPGSKNGQGKNLEASPLIIAAGEGKMGIVQQLVRRNANINFVDALRGTPVYRAREGKHEDIARYLEGLGATDVPETARKNPLRVGDKRPQAPTPGATGNSTGNPGNRGTPTSRTGGDGDTARRPRAPSSGLFGTDAPPPIPPAPGRPVYEVTAANVLGGPLSELWTAFSGEHPDWRLDAQGRRNDLGPGLTMRGNGKIESLPTDWASEIHSLGVSRGMVPTNPEAKILVAPQGGLAIVAEQERQFQQALADQATAERDARLAAEREADSEGTTRRDTPEDETPSSQASGRPGS